MQLLVFGAPPDPLVRHSPAKSGHQPATAELRDTGQTGERPALSPVPSTPGRGVGGGC